MDYQANKHRFFDKNTCDFLYLGGLMNIKGGITLMNAWEKAERELANLNAFLYFGGPNSKSEIFNRWKNVPDDPTESKSDYLAGRLVF